MINIYGYFKDIKNNTRYDVTLVKLTNDQSINLSIEESSDSICFDFSKPVEITVDYSDTFQHVIIKQAEIGLVVNDNFKNIFFADNARDFSVTIEVHDGPVLFKGYLDPLVFQEPYAKDWTKFSLSCSDKIATLQYKKYGELQGVNPNEQDKPIDIITNICDYIGLEPDIDSLSNEVKDILENTKINNSIWFGDSPDDWMKCDEVLEEIGKYAGIWFSQEEDDILRCFSWHESERSTPRQITEKDFSGNDTNISVSDVYTQIRLNCELDEQDTLVDFDSEDLTNETNKFKYMEEYITEGGGSNKLQKFITMVNSYGEIQGDDENVYTQNCFAQIKRSSIWNFGANNYLDNYNENAPQTVLSWLYSNPGKGAFISFGKSEKVNNKSNNPQSDLSMTDSLIISIGGHDEATNTSVLNNFTSYICKYSGSAGTITPSAGATNYLIVSGTIYLNPLYAQIASKSQMHDAYFDTVDGGLYLDSLHTFQDFKTMINTDPASIIILMWCSGGIPYRDGYYLQRYLSGTGNNPVQTNSKMLHGDLKCTKYAEQWEYKWSYIGGDFVEIDNITKIPIFLCELKVGNKWCVERYDLGEEGLNRFEWLTEQELPYNSTTQEYNKYFTIGINPKLGDKIIGKDHEISNTIDYYMGLEGKGMAIPIKDTDNLNGSFEFKIIKPIDSYWERLNKRYHGWWFTEHEILDVDSWPILQKLSSILIKNFKIEISSDKGKIETLNSDGDLVYASDENDNYIDPHEDDIKLSTMLTTYECGLRGVDVVVSPNHLLRSDGSQYLGMSYTGTGDNVTYIKPEDYYVNNFYNEYSIPRTVIETTLGLDEQYSYIIKPYSYNFEFNSSYYESGYFVPVKYETLLKENKVKYTMKNMS